MERKGFGSNQIMVVFFGVVMIILVITGVSYAFWPLVRFGLFSPCWGNFVSSFNVMTGMEILRSPQEISVGECVNSIHFVNQDSVSNVAEELGYWWLDCEPDHPAYVIGIPWTREGSESFWDYFSWDKQVKQRIAEFWKNEMGGIEPVCKALDKPLREEKQIRGPGLSASATYCMGLKKDGDYYIAAIKTLPADMKCNQTTLFGEESGIFG
jgi:hypothetical protein